MKTKTIIEKKKQVHFFATTEDWLLLRKEAAEHGILTAELIRRWVKPQLDRLKAEEANMKQIR